MSSTFSDRKPDKDEAETSTPKAYKAHPDWRDIKMPLAPISTWKESTKARVLPHDPALFRWILRVKHNAATFIMQMPEPYLDLETSPDDIGRMYGPTFAKNSGYPSDMVGSVYSVQLVKIRADSEGVETNITAREHECDPTEYPLRAWNFERPNGGEIPKHVAEHLAWRKANEGRTCAEPDPDAAKDGDYRVEDVEFLDGEDGPPDSRDRGPRGRDRDPMDDRFGGDPRGQRDPFAGAVAGGGFDAGGGYGPAAQGFPGAGPRTPYGAAPNVVAPPPPKMANGHLWTGSPPGFNPPEPGEWKHCPSGRAEWVGNHYEPAPMATPTTVNGAAPAEELPPVVNGLLRMANGSYVPIPHGFTRVSAGNWVPNPDPNAPITNPARQLAEPPPPYPDKIEGTNQFLLNGGYKDCPYGIYYSEPLRQWIPKPEPPPVAKPVVEEKPQKMTLAETLALITGAGTALASIFGAVQGPRLENERAAEERRREEAKAAVERAKAEAEAAKENARVLADAQKEAARLQADAQIKAAELAAQRDREAREADERRRTEQANLAREDRIREETRREEERKREHALLLQRTADEATERRRREDREREERVAAETRMEKIITIATAKPAALPVTDPALEALKLELATARREASKGGDFASEFKRMKSLAEAMGAKFGEVAGPASDPDVIGPLMVTAAEKTFELVERFIKSRESGAPAAATQHVNIMQSPRPPGPPRAGFIWGWDGVRFVEVPLAPMQPQLPPTPAPVQLPQPQYTAPAAPEPTVTESAPYVPPATQPEPVAEPQWSSVPAEEPPAPAAEPPAEVTPPAEF